MICKSGERMRDFFGPAFCFYCSLVFSSFFASHDAMNEYCGDRNVYRKLSTVDGNDNFRRLPSPLINGTLTLISLKYTYAII